MGVRASKRGGGGRAKGSMPWPSLTFDGSGRYGPCAFGGEACLGYRDLLAIKAERHLFASRLATTDVVDEDITCAGAERPHACVKID